MVKKYEDSTRDLCNQLIDGFVDTGRADAGTDYAQQIPVRVIATMLGVGTDRSDEFVGWVRGILEQGLTDREVRMTSTASRSCGSSRSRSPTVGPIRARTT